MTTYELHTSSLLAAVPGPPERVVHACADARARQRARRTRQVLAAMEAARQAERIGLELFEQGVTEQDVHIIYGEMHVLRELQQKRAAKDAAKRGEGEAAAARGDAWRKGRAQARATLLAERAAARRSAAAAEVRKGDAGARDGGPESPDPAANADAGAAGDEDDWQWPAASAETGSLGAPGEPAGSDASGGEAEAPGVGSQAADARGAAGGSAPAGGTAADWSAECSSDSGGSAGSAADGFDMEGGERPGAVGRVPALALPPRRSMAAALLSARGSVGRSTRSAGGVSHRSSRAERAGTAPGPAAPDPWDGPSGYSFRRARPRATAASQGGFIELATPALRVLFPSFPRDGDGRPKSSGRTDWRYGGQTDRSGEQGGSGSGPYDAEAAAEPNQLEWLHWVAARVAAEGAGALAACGCPPELWDEFQAHLKLHPEQWAGPWLRDGAGGGWRRDTAGIRPEHLAQMRAGRSFARPGGHRSGPSVFYDDPYTGGPYGGPAGPPTKSWRYWAATSRPFEEAAAGPDAPPAAKEAAPGGGGAPPLPPMRGGRPRSGPARDLQDREPWPDPATRPPAAEAGGQFAFGRRLPVPGAPRAPAEPAAGAPGRSPAAGHAQVAGPPAPAARTSAEQRRRTGGDRPPAEGGACPRRDAAQSGHRRGSAGPDTDQAPDPGASSAHGKRSRDSSGDACAPGHSRDATPDHGASASPEADPSPDPAAHSARLSLPTTIGAAARQPPSRTRRVTMYGGTGPPGRRVARARRTRGSHAPSLDGDWADAAGQGSGPSTAVEHVSSARSADGEDAADTSARPSTADAPEQRQPGGRLQRGAAAPPRARGKSIAFALGVGAPDDAVDAELGGGGLGREADARDPRFRAPAGGEGRVRRGRSRGPPPDRGLAADPVGAPRGGGASPAHALPESYQLMDLVRREAGAVSGLAAELEALAPPAQRRRHGQTLTAPRAVSGAEADAGLGASRAQRQSLAVGRSRASPHGLADQLDYEAPGELGPDDGDVVGAPADAWLAATAWDSTPAHAPAGAPLLRRGTQRQDAAGPPRWGVGLQGGAGLGGGGTGAPNFGVRASHAWPPQPAAPEGAGQDAGASADGAPRPQGVLVVPGSAANQVWLVPVAAEVRALGSQGAPAGLGLQLLGVPLQAGAAPPSREGPAAAPRPAPAQLGWGQPRASAATYPRPAAPSVASLRQEGFDGSVTATGLAPGGAAASAAGSRPATGASAAGAQGLGDGLLGFCGASSPRMRPSVWRGRTKLAGSPRAAAPWPGGLALAGTGVAAAAALPAA